MAYKKVYLNFCSINNIFDVYIQTLQQLHDTKYE